AAAVPAGAVIVVAGAVDATEIAATTASSIFAGAGAITASQYMAVTPFVLAGASSLVSSAYSSAHSASSIFSKDALAAVFSTDTLCQAATRFVDRVPDAALMSMFAFAGPVAGALGQRVSPMIGESLSAGTIAGAANVGAAVQFATSMASTAVPGMLEC